MKGWGKDRFGISALATPTTQGLLQAVLNDVWASILLPATVLFASDQATSSASIQVRFRLFEAIKSITNITKPILDYI